jgi:hypothetical protein
MKNIFVVLVSALLLSIFQNANAQEIKNDKTNENVDFLQFYENEMFHWSLNTSDGLILNYGNDNWKYSTFSANIKNEKIRNALLEYPDSAQAYNSFRKNTINGNIVYWTGLALMIGSIVPVLSVENEKLSNGLYFGMLGGGLTLSVIGIYQFNSAQSNLFNAVNMFNKNKVRELNK